MTLPISKYTIRQKIKYVFSSTLWFNFNRVRYIRCSQKEFSFMPSQQEIYTEIVEL